MAGKRGTITARQRKRSKDSTSLRRDLEEGTRPQGDHKYRFRDQSSLDADDRRRVQFKKTLLESVNRSKFLEEYRKSDEEVCPSSTWSVIFIAANQSSSKQ